MEIMKIFSSYDDYGYEDERLYSVLISEDELRFFNEYTAGVTKYDRTDRIKQMKDSDVLAEKKRSNTRSYINAAKAGGVGALIGSGLGAAASIATKGRVKMGNAAKAGAIAGGLVVGGGKLAATHGEREQNRFVNRRLNEAKRQAIRREAKDWKNNAVNREGYTY